jgi:hypothetical protein
MLSTSTTNLHLRTRLKHLSTTSWWRVPKIPTTHQRTQTPPHVTSRTRGLQRHTTTTTATRTSPIRNILPQNQRPPPRTTRHQPPGGSTISPTRSLTKLGSTHFPEQVTVRTNYQKDSHHGMDNVVVHHHHHDTRTTTTSETFHVQGARHHHPPTVTALHRIGAVTLSRTALRSHARRERPRHA